MSRLLFLITLLFFCFSPFINAEENNFEKSLRHWNALINSPLLKRVTSVDELIYKIELIEIDCTWYLYEVRTSPFPYGETIVQLKTIEKEDGSISVEWIE